MFFVPIYDYMNYDCLRKDLEFVTQKRVLEVGDSIVEALKRLDEAQHTDLPDRLQHFLSQRSYTKALLWLDNPDMPHHP